MDRELIIRLAREAELWEMLEGYSSEYASGDAERDCLPDLERFAALVVQAEREACAQIAKQWDIDHPSTNYGGCISNLIRSRKCT